MIMFRWVYMLIVTVDWLTVVRAADGSEEGSQQHYGIKLLKWLVYSKTKEILNLTTDFDLQRIHDSFVLKKWSFRTATQK